MACKCQVDNKCRGCCLVDVVTQQEIGHSAGSGSLSGRTADLKEASVIKEPPNVSDDGTPCIEDIPYEGIHDGI